MKLQILLISLITALSFSVKSLASETGKSASFETGPHNVWGVWLNPDETAKIEITDCSDATPCGKIIWVTHEGNENPPDANNPDPELATRPLTGVKMLHSFSRKNTKWANGKIYNPEDGKSYKSSIRTKDDGTLEVKGCLGPFCKTQIWTHITP